MNLRQLLNNVEMTVRAGNAACNANCRTRRDLRDKILSGDILKLRNCGIKTLKELYTVAGLTWPEPKVNACIAELLFSIEAAVPFVEAEVGERECSSSGGPNALKCILSKYNWANERWKWL